MSNALINVFGFEYCGSDSQNINRKFDKMFVC